MRGDNKDALLSSAGDKKDSKKGEQKEAKYPSTQQILLIRIWWI
jgi:hypothetical protein